jgi:hypothetical protein
MINFRPSRIEDVDNIKLRKQYDSEPGVKESFQKAIKSGFPAYTLVHENGTILVILNGGFVWEGVLSLSALVSEDIKKYPTGVTKAVRTLMNAYQKIQEIHRIQVTVRDDFPEAKRWITFLGFYFEGTLYGYGQDKSDYGMFARYF